MPELRRSVGYLFLQETKFDRDALGIRSRPLIQPAEPFKRYPEADKVLLPRSWNGEGDNLWGVLQKRRSQRDYAGESLTLTDLALLLWASQGVTAQAGPYYMRTAPSAGALYPIETYVAVQKVEGVAPGVVHFDVRGFHLERLTSEPPGPSIGQAAMGQGFLGEAAAVFVWSAVLRRTMTKYGHRGMRYVFLDAGHICQNLLLAAEALGLGACPVGAFFDDELNGILGIDGQEETVVYMAAVGRKGA